MSKRTKKKEAPVINPMRFEIVPIDAVRYHPRNPRQGDVGAICESLDENGFFGAVLVQESTGFILAGEHRHKSMKASGAREVPVLFIDVDDERALNIMLADNATADSADYDRSALPLLLADIHEQRGNLQGTGYTEERLQELLDDLKYKEEQNQEAFANPNTKERAAPNLDPGGERYQEQYGVIVICANEAEQERVFTQLSLEYRQVKVVVT